MTMTESEIVKSYKEAKVPKNQVQILADLNACKKGEIIEILFRHGCLNAMAISKYRLHGLLPPEDAPETAQNDAESTEDNIAELPAETEEPAEDANVADDAADQTEAEESEAEIEEARWTIPEAKFTAFPDADLIERRHALLDELFIIDEELRHRADRIYKELGIKHGS